MSPTIFNQRKSGMKAIQSIVAALILAAGAAHAQDSGFYLRGAIGQAHTTLDTSNTVHATYITGESVNKPGLEIGGGYRFNRHVGAELSYVDFGKPHYDLTRRTTGETSVLYVKNRGLVTAVRGFYPVGENFTLTGRIGAIFVRTSLDRQSVHPDSAYTGRDKQTHATFGIGGMYKLIDRLSLVADINWYPKITKTNDNATDTNARMASVGLQYDF
ncbi:outer membrane beta-barrel protein [Thauera sinica]|uniref:Outer membrane beta-barrel protein n=1 Tax=Thauera sinica TaxID=2665146 RepID=A0ABW1AMK0_9RHOO|nr:outer membrane beta-barrel protein [Thauera sp. K11]